jgi:hypothetical protein
VPIDSMLGIHAAIFFPKPSIADDQGYLNSLSSALCDEILRRTVKRCQKL